MSVQKQHLVVAAIIVEDDKILVTQRLPDAKFGNQWEFPGGKLEWGESPEAGLRRELHEELGIEAEIGDPVHVINYALNDASAFAVIFYWTRITGGTLTLKGVQAADWITVHRLTEIDFLPTNLPVVERLLARVRSLGMLAPSFQ